MFNNIYLFFTDKVKKIAEIQVGILTQCLKAKTVYKLNPATLSNILLKVNAKLNGLNHNIAANVWYDSTYIRVFQFTFLTGALALL
jgi:hypothetical protein